MHAALDHALDECLTERPAEPLKYIAQKLRVSARARMRALPMPDTSLRLYWARLPRLPTGDGRHPPCARLPLAACPRPTGGDPAVHWRPALRRAHATLAVTTQP